MGSENETFVRVENIARPRIIVQIYGFILKCNSQHANVLNSTITTILETNTFTYMHRKESNLLQYSLRVRSNFDPYFHCYNPGKN